MKRFLQNESGQGMVEYGLIIASLRRRHRRPHALGGKAIAVSARRQATLGS